jgi:undecaprenyl-diphosphatase
MLLPLWLLSTIMGIVEGLTEFIPISSTGHLIIADHFLKFKEALGDPDKAELFEVVIQLGAILAIGFLYRAKLWNALNAKDTHSGPGRLRTQLMVAFIPVAIVGFLFHSAIKEYLWSPLTVALSLIIGGFVILYVESFISVHKQKKEMKTLTTKDALVVGLAQILSLIPGVSRSGATIIGGMMNGMNRETATEFSFLLSFPVMIAASGYELYKYRNLLSSDMFATLGIGFAVSFIVALAVVRWLIEYVRKNDFIMFGVYRVAFGIIILVLWLQGTVR